MSVPADPSSPRGPGGRLDPRGLLRRTPLRVKLVVTLLVVTALALTVAGVGATAALRGELLQEFDRELQRTYGNAARSPDLLGDEDGPSFPGYQPTFVGLRLADGTMWRTVRLDDRTDYADPEVPDRLPDRVGPDNPITVSPVTGSGPDWRMIAQPLPDGTIFYVAQSLEPVWATTQRLAVLQILVGAAVLLLLGIVGLVVIRRSLAPLVEIEEVAEDIAAGNLARRVPEPDERTEVGRLAGALNGMLARIEGAIRDREAAADAAQHSEQRMRRFVADASHELRTPLTSIRGFAELHRQGAVPPGPESDRVMSRIESEAARMNVLVEDLLLLARLDQARPLGAAPVDLVPLVVDTAYDARAVAPDREIRVETGGLPHAMVLGDEVRLRQVLGNLLSNALTHTPAGSPVDLRIGSEPGHLLFEVSDRGPGLTDDQRARVFERFYRVDAARTRSAGGSGLGLAIVQAIVAAHGGRVEVMARPGGGATFCVALPALVSGT